MSKKLSDVVEIDAQFARSANLERDSEKPLDSYVPTGRAREVVRLVAGALASGSTGLAMSITGTYGSGKSSLALFVRALFGANAILRKSALERLRVVDPELADKVEASVTALPGESLVVIATTAQREPVVETLRKALVRSLTEGDFTQASKKLIKPLLEAGKSDAESITEAVQRMSEEHGLLLVIDEFGKNIEEFVHSGDASSDLFVLQQLAEFTSGETPNPVFLILLQHLAFADYDKRGVSSREWSKIQGRFADIAYTESSFDAQLLMARVFSTETDLSEWASKQKKSVDAAGLRELLHVPIVDLFPLSPLTAVLLPDLCNKYGQNERTMFAFLAGPDAGAVPGLLSETPVQKGKQLPAVNLWDVYDYFLASAPSMVTASPHASRWIEIETRIRDAVGLSAEQVRALKAIAVLNLVSAGGAARASRAVLHLALVEPDGQLASTAEVNALLKDLETGGYITYREFADEFRIWNGTDFDLQAQVDSARRAIVGTSPAQLINEARPQIPVVASRHSQTTGVMRVFDRLFIDATSDPLGTELGQDFDGLVLLCIGDPSDVTQRQDVRTIAETRPVVLGVISDDSALSEIALSLAAQKEALRQAESSNADWVAIREMRERVAAATVGLDALVDDFNAGGSVSWFQIVDGESVSLEETKSKPLPSVLSSLCDVLYPATPLVRNEMLSRRSLTSQGAKARRNLLEAMLAYPDAERCGIEGYPPERAMYEAVLAASGIHRKTKGVLSFQAPTKGNGLGYRAAWDKIEECFSNAGRERLELAGIYAELMRPPVGLKEGPIPILLIAALLEHEDDVAIYEDGTFVARLDITVVERMIRNPENFALQSYVLRGPRRHLAEKLLSEIGASARNPKLTRLPSVVSVVGPLLTRLKSLPEYSLKTKRIDEKTQRFRTVLLQAREPDTLLFEGIPHALGHTSVGARETQSLKVDDLVQDVMAGISELSELYPKLLQRIQVTIAQAAGLSETRLRDELRERFSALRSAPIDPELRTLVSALTDEHLDDDEWLAYMGMISQGKPTQSWLDADEEQGLNHLRSSIRRIRNLEALPSEIEPGRRALRLALTEQDGYEEHRVVVLDDESLSRMRAITKRAVAQARKELGEVGDEALLASLTLDLLRSDATGDRADLRKGRE